eukprot:366497-Chlamydomonas_euryale.AAC.5
MTTRKGRLQNPTWSGTCCLMDMIYTHTHMHGLAKTLSNNPRDWDTHPPELYYPLGLQNPSCCSCQHAHAHARAPHTLRAKLSAMPDGAARPASVPAARMRRRGPRPWQRPH